MFRYLLVVNKTKHIDASHVDNVSEYSKPNANQFSLLRLGGSALSDNRYHSNYLNSQDIIFNLYDACCKCALVTPKIINTIDLQINVSKVKSKLNQGQRCSLKGEKLSRSKSFGNMFPQNNSHNRLYCIWVLLSNVTLTLCSLSSLCSDYLHLIYSIGMLYEQGVK